MTSFSTGSSSQSQGGNVTGNPSGNLSHPLNKTITMATIAKAAGVSQGAISSLLNDRDYGIRVSEKTRERVFKTCRELGYIPNDLRAVVRMYPEWGDLCVLASSGVDSLVANSFYARILKGAVAALSSPSRRMTLAEYDEALDYTENAELLPQPVQSGTASKFICIGAANPSLFQTLLKRDFPVAFLGRDMSQPGITTIQPDYASGSRLAMEHLLKAGHRHIAILSGPFGTTDHAIIELNRGVRLACEAAGIPFDAQNIIYGDLSFQSGVNAIPALLSSGKKPTALLCLSDEVAAGALVQARQQGLAVPGQLSVIGCADNPIAEAMALTTIHLPAEEMGATAVRDVEARVQEGALNDSRKIVLPLHLVERSSCTAI